jgi:hypothetical protein
LVSWDLPELKSLLENRYGIGHQELAFESLDSIFQNQDFSRYHYYEINRLISEHLAVNETSKDYFNLRMSNDIDVRESEFFFSTACKAHIISLLRHLHCSPDLLAHAIYYCLGLNLSEDSSLKVRDITLYKIKKILENKIEYNKLFELIKGFTGHIDYEYLQAWGNHTKHRASIVPSLSYRIVAEGTEIYNFTFEVFSYQGKKYSTETVMSFLNREFDREGVQIILIGSELNYLVGK